MNTFRFNQCLVLRDGGSVRVRCPADEKTELEIGRGSNSQKGNFKPGAALFAMVQGAKGEPGINPFEDIKEDLSYSPYIEFIFHGETFLGREDVGGKPWLVVKSAGSVDLYGTMDASPFDEQTMGAASWMTVTADPNPGSGDCGPHAPKREGPASA